MVISHFVYKNSKNLLRFSNLYGIFHILFARFGACTQQKSPKNGFLRLSVNIVFLYCNEEVLGFELLSGYIQRPNTNSASREGVCFFSNTTGSKPMNPTNATSSNIVELGRVVIAAGVPTPNIAVPVPATFVAFPVRIPNTHPAAASNKLTAMLIQNSIVFTLC
jgi:hypothetical protein